MAPNLQAVATLRGRHEEIASEITLQKTRLAELEKKEKDVLAQLNDILDPLARLPLEVSANIFRRCLPSRRVPSPKLAPLLLLTVCRSWRNIALDAPALWDTIYRDEQSPRSGEFSELMEVWLSRAGGRPLSISLHGALDPGVDTVLDEYADQVERLELFVPSTEELQAVTGPFTALKTLTLGHCDVEPDSDVDDDDYDVNNDGFDPDECVRLMCDAPNLVECKFEGISYGGEPNRWATLHTHSSLKHLHLGAGGFDSGFEIRPSCTMVLEHVLLPALETLWIPDCTIDYDEFHKFLTQSSAPLKAFGISIPASWKNVAPLLRLIPNLTELDIEFGNFNAAGKTFIEALVASEFLPTLRKLTIRVSLSPDHAQYKQLVTALAARSRMESFRLLWKREPVPTVPTDIIAALQKLKVDIHVGTAQRNLVGDI